MTLGERERSAVPLSERTLIMAKKTAKTSVPSIVGRFAKIDHVWCVAFPASTPIAKGTVVSVMTADKREKQVRTNSEGVVLFDVKTESVSAEIFYTFDRIASK